jgi:hypothetical protein
MSMSADGQFQSLRGNDWVEQLRDRLKEEQPSINEAVLDAAYDAGEIDAATMFAYFEDNLSEAERREVEAEAAASSHALNKLTRVGAIVAQSRAGALAAGNRSGSVSAKPQSPASPNVAAAALSPALDSSERTPSKSPRVVHRVYLGEPRPSLGTNSLPRAEDCVRISADSPCEFYRSLEKDRDQVRIFHQSAPAGTMVRMRILPPDAAESTPDAVPRFAVLRRGSESSTTTTLTIPDGFNRSEVTLEVAEIPPADLTADDVGRMLIAYEEAAQDDPIAVTPLHEPRSAWELWADAVLDCPIGQVAPAVREFAELIAGI